MHRTDQHLQSTDMCGLLCCITGGANTLELASFAFVGVQAAGRPQEAAAVRALKPGGGRKGRRASAPAAAQAMLPEPAPCQRKPPSVQPPRPSRRISDPAGPCRAASPYCHADGPTTDPSASAAAAKAGNQAPVANRAERSRETPGAALRHADLVVVPGLHNGVELRGRRGAGARRGPVGESRTDEAGPQGRPAGILKGLRMLITGTDRVARAEADCLASSMGATILQLNQVGLRHLPMPYKQC